MAIVSTAAAGSARLFLWPDFFRQSTFYPFFAAVLLTAWYGGLGPGVLCLLVGAAVIEWAIFPPAYHFELPDPQSQIGLLLFIALGSAICIACHSLHAARVRQRSAQEQLLEREVQRAKMEATAAQMIEESKRKDEFLAILAHELRNPLAPVVYALDLAKRDARRVGEALASIERQIRQLSRLVDDLIDLDRIGQGKLRIERTPTRAREIVAAAVEATDHVIRQHRHQLAVDLPGAGLVVDVDAVRATQVLTNLLSNAAKFTPPGGRIAVETHAAETGVTFCVTDNGVGIEPVEVPRLLRLFEQGPTPGHCAPSGLGVGLALAGSIMELHGGALRLEPASSGRGTRACVTFQRADAVPADPSPVAAAARHAFKKILVADDNPDAALTLGTLLESEGHEVTIATDGNAACERAAELHPDLALLDIGMPGRSGIQVCEWIRAQRWGHACRIVAITGWGQDTDIEKTREAGFDAHLVKPVGMDTVLQLVASLGDALSHASASDHAQPT